ncbi:hypothetical protein DAKH74_012120 [Maudiozyma humilis]|uniref:Uncharacterized protein n=1 Tax=Maudiozyma humilis TaxID=51915 RepID=A0AAV5RVC5_MAUHU|nr:hypothetical protein DAKH74_012120 [Kazachstania humilis]
MRYTPGDDGWSVTPHRFSDALFFHPPPEHATPAPPCPDLQPDGTQYSGVEINYKYPGYPPNKRRGRAPFLSKGLKPVNHPTYRLYVCPTTSEEEESDDNYTSPAQGDDEWDDSPRKLLRKKIARLLAWTIAGAANAAVIYAHFSSSD